jgi:putative membrane protein
MERIVFMRKLPLALAAASLIGFAAGAASAAQLSPQDEQFVKQAAQGGMEEIQSGQAAEQKGASPAVKQLGRTLVTDHTMMDDQLKRIAQQQGFTLPQSLDQEDRQELQQMNKLNGAEFDKQFTGEQIEDHTKMIQLLQKEAQTTQDPALRSFAQSGIPVMQKHLRMAQQAQSAG